MTFTRRFGQWTLSAIVVVSCSIAIIATARDKAKVQVMGVDHVAIVVKDLKDAKDFYGKLLGVNYYDIAPLVFESVGGKASAMDSAGIQLVQAGDANSPTGKFLVEAGEQVWALAFRTPDIEQAVAAMKAHGMPLLGRGENAIRKEALFDPKATVGVAIKLVQYNPMYTVRTIGAAEAWRERHGVQPKTSPLADTHWIDHYIFRVFDLSKSVAVFDALFDSPFPTGNPRVSVNGLGLELIGNADRQGVKDVFGQREGMSYLSIRVRNFYSLQHRLLKAGYEVTGENIQPSREVALMRHPERADFELIRYEMPVHPIVALELAEEVRKDPPKPAK